MLKDNLRHIIFIIIFTGITGVLFILNLSSLYSIVKTEIRSLVDNEHRHEFLFPAEIEERYDDNFYGKLSFVDINGLTHKALQQKVMNGAVKDENGQLNLVENTEYRFYEKTEAEKVEKALTILKYAENNEADVLYVQRPWKNSDNTEVLPYGMKLEYKEQFDYWCSKMTENGIPVLDLRKALNEDQLVFYKTDHHWTVRSSLYGAEAIIKELNYQYEYGLDEGLLDISEYNIDIYNDCFLGSGGVKTGKYYVGQDDFEVFYPKFETNFTFRQLAEHEEYFKIEGQFKDVFIDWDILENKEYNNKYNAISYGAYNENIIINNMIDDERKVLLIADSFARPMVPFLSLYFKEARFLDPQEGRYTDSYIEYIEKYDPDIVIMMFPGDGEFQNV